MATTSGGAGAAVVLPDDGEILVWRDEEHAQVDVQRRGYPCGAVRPQARTAPFDEVTDRGSVGVSHHGQVGQGVAVTAHQRPQQRR